MKADRVLFGIFMFVTFWMSNVRLNVENYNLVDNLFKACVVLHTEITAT